MPLPHRPLPPRLRSLAPPRAVWAHLNDPGRCRRHPWVDDIPDAALVAAPFADDFARLLPHELLSEPRFSHQRAGTWDSRNQLRDDILQGCMIRSPLPGVPAQRWAAVATTAARDHGPEAIERALTPDGFAALEDELLNADRITRCEICGDTTTTRGLRNHQNRNRACRWRQSTTEVRHLWTQGWRDPFTTPGVPLGWTELRSKATWRRRTHLVPFTAWTAVLVRAGDVAAPAAAESAPRGTGAAR